MTANKNGSTSITRLSSRQSWHALIGAAGIVLSAPALARAESTWFDIAPQPLPAALRAFAAQAKMQLLYEHDAVSSVSGNAVIGELDEQAALAQLLRNTGMEIVYSANGAATIRPATQLQPHASENVDPSDRMRVAQVGQPASRHAIPVEPTKSTLEEIIVTARRREENVQTVPVAVTVVSQQTLQENNVTTLNDLQYLVPAMSASMALSRDTLNLSIRGQGVNGFSGLPGAIVYLNEIPIPTDKDGNTGGGPGLFFDLENAQVLKGPQGTLFGRNTIGGALLLQSKKPTNEFGGRIQLTGGNYNDREVDGALNLPLVDQKLLARVAFSGQKRDGYTPLLREPGHPNGIDTDDRNYWATRGSLTFHPTDWFENDFVLTYVKYSNHGSPSSLTAVDPKGLAAFLYSGILTQFAQQQAVGPRTVIAVDAHLKSSGNVLSLSNISRFALTDELTLRNIFGYDDSRTVYELDLDSTSFPLFSGPTPPRDQTVRQYTEELQLLGKSFSGRLDWLAGVFYLKQRPPEKYVLQAGTTFGFPADAEYRQGDTSKAAFAQGTYEIVKNLKFTAGARYTKDERFHYSRGGNLGSHCTEPRVNCSVTTMQNPESSAVTWTVGFDYQPTQDTLLYVTSRRGYRAGGTNIQKFNGTTINFSPEYLTDVEVGTKSDWKIVDIPVRTNLAIFWSKYRDIQISEARSNSQGLPITLTTNAASARLRGAEFEGLVKATDNLELGGYFAYLSFQYTDFGQLSAPTVTQLEQGRTINRPPRKYGVSARYHLPLAPQIGDISLQANWNWQSRSGTESLPGGSIDSYGLLNASINWDKIGGGPLDASLFGSNLTDKLYATNASVYYPLIGFVTTRYGEPRMYGLRLRYRFGAE